MQSILVFLGIVLISSISALSSIVLVRNLTSDNNDKNNRKDW